jgi:hypothetical protein
MKAIIFALLAGLATTTARAHSNHTQNFCHPEVKNFCAHIGYNKDPQVGDEFIFVVDLVTTKEILAQVQSADVKLVMPDMDHGAAPVKIERLDANHFQVTEAYFTMAGSWVVQVRVTTATGVLDIEIPMEVK